MDKRLLRTVTSISVNDAWWQYLKAGLVSASAQVRAHVCLCVCVYVCVHVRVRDGWAVCLSVCLSFRLSLLPQDKDLIVRKVAEEAGFERTLRK